MRGPVEQVIQQLLRARDEQIHLVGDENRDASVAASSFFKPRVENLARAVRAQALAEQFLCDRAVGVRGGLQPQTVELDVVEPREVPVAALLP